MRALRPGPAFLLALAAHGCAAQAGGVAWSRQSVPIERVALGHTMDHVRQTLGEPGGVALDATPAGQERVIWYYAAGPRVSRSLEGRVETTVSDPVSREQTHSIDAGSAGLCRVVFVDGRVAGIRLPD